MGCCMTNNNEDKGLDLQIESFKILKGSDHKGTMQATCDTYTPNRNHPEQTKTNISNLHSHDPSPNTIENEDDEHGNNLVIDVPLSVRVISKEEIESAPQLDIEVIEGTVIERGKIFSMNAGGMIGSKRASNDGCLFMGTQQTNPDTGEYTNDFIVDSKELGMGKRHLVIKYHSDNSSYFIRDLGDGTGTFVKIDNSLKLRNNYIISFGDSHFYVMIKLDGKIQLKFLDGPKSDQTFTFSPSDRLVKIGRMSDCDIKFEENTFSRYQCCIQMVEGNWMLSDGDSTRSSTNGTWLFAEELFPVFNGMIFKAGQTLFQVRICE